MIMTLCKKLLISALIFILPIYSYSNNENNDIKVINLYGSFAEQGRQYGKEMKLEMNQSLDIIKNFYINEHGLKYNQLVEQATKLYDRYPYQYKQLIIGAAEGSQLSLNDTKILNAMETMGELLISNMKLSGCAFGSISGSQTFSKNNIILRNYDFPKPFDEISKYLTVTILHNDNYIDTAIISMPGQLYCPTCINAKGLFIELNNGMPSGGYDVNYDVMSMLVDMLFVMQNSEDIEQAQSLLNSFKSDYSLAVNLSDKNKTYSYEYSTKDNGNFKINEVKQNDSFISTNFFQNIGWKNNDFTDDSSSKGITRRNNLLKEINDKKDISIDDVKDIMSLSISNGGARSKLTIYQLIYDTKSMELYVNIPILKNNWQTVNLKDSFR